MSSISTVITALRETPKTSLEVGGSPGRLFAAFDEALTEGDLELAEASLRLIEVSLMLRDEESAEAETVMSELVRCHHHLWALKHIDAHAVAA